MKRDTLDGRARDQETHHPALSRRMQELNAVFTPSDGLAGTTYAVGGNADNPAHIYYVRTPWGNMRVENAVGSTLMFRQLVIRRQLAYRRYFLPVLFTLLLATLAVIIA